MKRLLPRNSSMAPSMEPRASNLPNCDAVRSPRGAVLHVAHGSVRLRVDDPSVLRGEDEALVGSGPHRGDEHAPLGQRGEPGLRDGARRQRSRRPSSASPSRARSSRVAVTTVTLRLVGEIARAHARARLSISKVMTLPSAPTMNAASAAPYPEPVPSSRESRRARARAGGTRGVGVRRTDGRKPLIVQGKGRVVRASLDVLGAHEAFSRDLEKARRCSRVDGARVPHHRSDQRQATPLATSRICCAIPGNLRHLPPASALSTRGVALGQLVHPRPCTVKGAAARHGAIGVCETGALDVRRHRRLARVRLRGRPPRPQRVRGRGVDRVLVLPEPDAAVGAGGLPHRPGRTHAAASTRCSGRCSMSSPGPRRTSCTSELERLAGGSASSIAPLGVIGFLWTASSGLHNLMDVFEIAASGHRAGAVVEATPDRPRVGRLGLAAACLLAWLLVTLDSAFHEHDKNPAPSATSVRYARALRRPLSPPRRRPLDVGADPTRRPLSVKGALKHRLSKAIHTPIEQILAAALLLALGWRCSPPSTASRSCTPGTRRRVWPGPHGRRHWLVVSWVFGLYAVSMARLRPLLRQPGGRRRHPRLALPHEPGAGPGGRGERAARGRAGRELVDLPNGYSAQCDGRRREAPGGTGGTRRGSRAGDRGLGKRLDGAHLRRGARRPRPRRPAHRGRAHVGVDARAGGELRDPAARRRRAVGHRRERRRRRRGERGARPHQGRRGGAHARENRQLRLEAERHHRRREQAIEASRRESGPSPSRSFRSDR